MLVIRVSGLAGQIVRIQRSLGLADEWTDFQTLTLGETFIELTEEIEDGADQGSFRPSARDCISALTPALSHLSARRPQRLGKLTRRFKIQAKEPILGAEIELWRAIKRGPSSKGDGGKGPGSERAPAAHWHPA